MKTNITLSEKIKNIKFINTVQQWALKHRKLSLAICIISIIVIGGAVTLAIMSNNSGKKELIAIGEPNTPKKNTTKYYSPLTGKLVDNEDATRMAVTGIMIPNDTYGARPQSGLKSAGVVFEAICEAGITRFLALYQQEKPKLVGPIRSIRSYYLSWAAPFNATIVHHGGSDEALKEIRSGDYRDLDQGLDSSASWRAPDRTGPDNSFTSFEKLDVANTSKGYIESEFIGFSRIDGKASESPTATNISVNISSAQFNSTYAYDSTTNTYARSQDGSPHIDGEGQITPSSIVAMNVDERSSMDYKNHEIITTIGSGPVKIFQNGEVIEGTWDKTGQFNQLTFTDSNNKDIPLVRGQTWIVAIPNSSGSINYTAPAPVVTTTTKTE